MENYVDQTQSQVGLLTNPAGSPQVILDAGNFYLENSDQEVGQDCGAADLSTFPPRVGECTWRQDVKM